MDLNLIEGASKGVATVISSFGKAIDDNVTNDEERMTLRNKLVEIMLDFQSKMNEGQVEINKIEATSESIFKSGWRPAIGWVCAYGIIDNFVVTPILYRFGIDSMQVDSGALMSLTLALLGMAGIRSYDKLKGLNK